MNDEIKEILDKLQKVANRETASRNALMEMKDKDYQLLLDYITNLKEKLDFMIDRNDEKQDKIDKAIEYCRLNKEFTPRLEDVENILEGSDK